MGGLMMCCFAAAVAQGPSQPQNGTTTKQHKTTQPQTTGTAMETRGEQAFQQNCNRCHNAPQELSSRISGTVVMHMRVRASLSAADAQAILWYLAP
jgi:cytochrome c5